MRSHPHHNITSTVIPSRVPCVLLSDSPNVSDSITLSGDERELGKVCVRLSYQEALEQVWITLVQVRLHTLRRGDTQKAPLYPSVAFLNEPSVCP